MYQTQLADYEHRCDDVQAHLPVLISDISAPGNVHLRPVPEVREYRP